MAYQKQLSKGSDHFVAYQKQLTKAPDHFVADKKQLSKGSDHFLADKNSCRKAQTIQCGKITGLQRFFITRRTGKYTTFPLSPFQTVPYYHHIRK
jgi:hypothetical protein